MVAITYECPNCHWHQGHAENCPSWYEPPSTEQPRTVPDTPYANAVLGMRERRAAEQERLAQPRTEQPASAAGSEAKHEWITTHPGWESHHAGNDPCRERGRDESVDEDTWNSDEYYTDGAHDDYGRYD